MYNKNVEIYQIEKVYLDDIMALASARIPRSDFLLHI